MFFLDNWVFCSREKQSKVVISSMFGELCTGKRVENLMSSMHPASTPYPPLCDLEC